MISKKIRFEVFKRDSFTCQYCGMAAPDVVLHVDHIDPKSKGGADDILNLLTSCSGCNSGKGARVLSDKTALQKRKATLDSLQARREQIEMMLAWHKGLESLESDAADELAAFWKGLTRYYLTEGGLHDLKGWLKKFEAEEVTQAMRISAAYYLRYEGEDRSPMLASVEKAFISIPGICRNRRQAIEDPRLDTANHVRAIARNKLDYINESELQNALLCAIDAGVEKQSLFAAVTQSRSWTRLKESILKLIDQAEEQ